MDDAVEGTAVVCLTVLVASGDGVGAAVEPRVLVGVPAVGVGAVGAFFLALFVAFLGLFVAAVPCVVGVAAALGVSGRLGVAFGDAEAGRLLALGAGVAGGALGAGVDSCTCSHD